MNQNEFRMKTEMIKENFNDPRKIKCPTPIHLRELDENVHQGGDIFTTEDGDFIDLEFQLVDFDEIELAKFVEFAEELYEKNHKHVSVYLLCPKEVNVCVKEFTIKSEADFTIKLAKVPEDSCRIFLKFIKNKLKNDEVLDCDDLHMLEMLPVMCAKQDRNYFRVETFKIINRILN